MHAGDFLIHPSQLGASTTDSWQPLGLVDLSAWPDSVPLRTLPPFPLIGLGDPSHPLARTLDAVVEPPVSVEALIRQVTRAPHTAAVAIQLLRSLDGLPVDRALQLFPGDAEMPGPVLHFVRLAHGDMTSVALALVE